MTTVARFQGNPQMWEAGRVLLVVAAPAEARAVLRGLGVDEDGARSMSERAWARHEPAPGFDVVVSGIGKSNAAGAAGRFLDPGRHAAVISLGVGGALPPDGPPDGPPGGPPVGPDGREDGGAVGGGLDLLQIVLGTASVFADEGLLADTAPGTPGGARWTDCAAMGFALGPEPVRGSAVVGDSGLGHWARARLESAGLVVAEGPIATVSTCSGTDPLAREVVSRTGAMFGRAAIVEGMEGAAVGLVAARLGGVGGAGAVAFAEVRVISNTTGARHAQRWDLRGALGVLERVTRALSARLV